MTTIDERVVSMKFDNRQFQKGVKDTQSALGALSKSLKLEGATKGLNDVNAAGKNVSLGHIATGVDTIAGRFKALSVVGITALATISHKATLVGGQLAKSLTIDPVKAGLQEYETNINSIQTILANTQSAGTTLEDVNSALEELNLYADQTIYNFSEMARNIGTFTAAGVALEPATAAIKGIANLAALSGSNSVQAATAMYQLSQAISAGRVTLEDWNSVVNAGMGGTVFQRALAQTAVAMGVLDDGAVKLTGDMQNVTIAGKSFRESVSALNGETWLTSDVLTTTLQQFTGDLTDAELAAQGFNKSQIEAIQQTAQTAKSAATEVKTVSQLMSTLQESAGSGWARTWQLIFGDFEEAKSLFTNVSDVLGSFVQASADTRNEVIGDWKELGGRTEIIKSISNSFNALISVLRPIREGFRSVFPATTGKQLYEMSVTIREFSEGLKIGSQNADRLKRTFAGVFAVLGIGWDITKEVAKTLFELFGIASEGSGDFLEVTAKIGDFLVGLREAIHEGEGLTKFFQGIGAVLAIPIKLLKLLGSGLSALFGEFDGTTAADGLAKFVGQLQLMTRLSDVVTLVWSSLLGVLDDVWDRFFSISSRIVDFLSNIGVYVSEGFAGVEYGDILGTINTGLFAGLVLGIRSLISTFTDGKDGLGGIVDSIGESFDGLTDTMSAMQNTLRAATLLQIAVAIAALTVSVVALSKIDSEGLTKALTAITVMFTQLFAAMAIFDKTAGFSGIAKMPLIAGSIILLGIALTIMASALKKLSDLDWEGLAKGMTGITVMLGALIATVKLMPPSENMIASSAGLILLATAINILASAVTDLSGLSWEEMAKGLSGVGALLGSLSLFTKFVSANKAGVLQGAGLILLASAIKILASALGDLSGLSWSDIGRGLSAMAGGLALMGAALYLIPPTSVISAGAILIVASSLGMIADALADMGSLSWRDIGAGLTALAGALTLIGVALAAIPPTAPITAAGILVVAASLGMIADALADMGRMNWDEIIRGLVGLGGALAIIAIGVNAMTGALAGAAALIVVAGALAIIAPILKLFGEMSWEEMGRGLLTLAGAFLVIGLAGVALTPVVPTLLGLGLALALIGAGVAAAGAGVFLFAAGLTALSIAGAAGTAAIVAMVAAMAGLIPTIATQLGLGLVAFAEVIATSGPAFTEAITVVLLSLIAAINKISPEVVETLFRLLVMLLEEMDKATPKMVKAGYDILVSILEGVRNNIRRVYKTALEIIAEFLEGIGEGLPSIIQSGVNLIISFIEGLAKAIENNSDRMGRAGGKLATAIIKGMVKGLRSGIGEIKNIARDVAWSALNEAKSLLGINSPSREFLKLGQFSAQGMSIGLDRYSTLVSNSAATMGEDAISALSRSLSGIREVIDSGVDMSPTISPVLDLTDVRKNAGMIDSILSTAKKISVDGAYSGAKEASYEYQRNQDDLEEMYSSGDNYYFTQNNTSPKALSNSEIYRQTKNQLSKVKEVAGT